MERPTPLGWSHWVLSSLVCLVLLSLTPPLDAAPSASTLRLLFLRQGDLWSAAPDGSDQRIALATGSTIQRYAVAPVGNRVAVVRRLGALDALEIHDLVTGEAFLVRAAEGFVESLAWTGEAIPHLGYSYAPDRQTPLRIFITQGGAGVQRLKLEAEERLLYFYPAPDGIVAVVKHPGGLRWMKCRRDATEEVRGFPGKSITAMPLDQRRWLASLYAPGVGRALQLLEAQPRGLLMRQEASWERAELRFSDTPAFKSPIGEPLKVVLRADSTDPGITDSQILIWDLARKQITGVVLPGELLVDAPIAEVQGKRIIFCSQHRDGAGYGTLPALWSLSWHGADRALLVANGQSPAWWKMEAAPELQAPGIDITLDLPEEPVIVDDPPADADETATATADAGAAGASDVDEEAGPPESEGEKDGELVEEPTDDEAEPGDEEAGEDPETETDSEKGPASRN